MTTPNAEDTTKPRQLPRDGAVNRATTVMTHPRRCTFSPERHIRPRLESRVTEAATRGAVGTHGVSSHNRANLHPPRSTVEFSSSMTGGRLPNCLSITLGVRVDWSHRADYIAARHGVRPQDANEALADSDAVVFLPDYASQSGRSVRTIGWSPSADRLLTVITLADGVLTYGVNAWPGERR